MCRRRCHNWTRPKMRYDEEIARIKARAMNKKYRFRFRAFPCKHCGDWHVGRLDEEERRKHA